MALKSGITRLKDMRIGSLLKEYSSGLRSFTFRIVGGAREGAVAGAREVVLVPFRTLVSYPFSFPFGRKGKVRDALALSFRPVLGESEGCLSLVPQIAEQTSSLTRGTAWFVAKTEIEEWEAKLGSAAFWPVQMGFVGEVNGSGLVIWSDSDGSSAMWFEEWVPVFCRWLPASDGGPDKLAEWVKNYAESSGKSIDSVKIICKDDVTPTYVSRCCEAALASAGGLETLDLSNSGVDTVQQLELFFRAAFKTVRILAILGIIFLVLSSVLLFQNIAGRSDFMTAPSVIYRSVFGEESNSPVTSAVRHLRIVTGSGDGAHMSLEQTLSNFAAAWKAAPQLSGVTVDSMRYGIERTEIQGLADSMSSVQALRDSLAKNGFSAKVGEVQQVPKSGLRFTILLTGAGQ